MVGGGWAKAAAMLKFLLAGGGATGRGAAPLRAQLLHMEMAGSVLWGVGAPAAGRPPESEAW